MLSDKVKPLLDWAVERLEQADCETSLLDARLLLQHAAGLTREDIILDPQREVGPGAVALFRHAIMRREHHEPVSRILGEREFYGRVFKVTPAVLDPRPDTETLVDAALKLMKPGFRILDLGTGTGAIIVTLLAETPGATGVATDVSPAALAVARSNAEALGVAPRLHFTEGSWFQPVAGRFDLIVSNPPYIPANVIFELEPDVRNFDPHAALCGGSDGLDAYREIASRVVAYLADHGHILVEIGAGQEKDVEGIFIAAGLCPSGRHMDLGNHIRCLSFAIP